MQACARYVMTRLLVLLLVVPAAFAQDNPPQEVPVFAQQELDRILAPIALYPDSLLSQILMASTYPLEVVEAARWSRANANLVGEQAVKAVDERNWDPSVKSLVAFPRILAMMDEKLDWMERLGDAFLAQQSQVMNTVQNLRQKAYAAGNLKSNDQYRVEQQGRTIVVESPRPEVIYVPYYDPLVVYGPWWWPAYPPVYWAPWPGFYARPGFVGFRWSVAVFIGPRFFFGGCDWHRRHVVIVNVNTFYTSRVVHRHVAPGHVWQHDPDHRRGVAYRHPSVRVKYVRSDRPFEVRREVRAHVPSSPGSHSESRNDRGKYPDARPGHVNQRPEERRGPPHNVGRDESRPNSDAGHGRAKPPTVRNEPNRRNDAPPSVARPNSETRPPARGGEGRGREERGHGNFIAQQRVADFDRESLSRPSTRGSEIKTTGAARDAGDYRRR